MKRSSSSWDILALSSVLKKRETSFFHRENRKFSGVSTQIQSRMKDALNMAKRSGVSFATLLGGNPVTTMVEMVAPMSP